MRLLSTSLVLQQVLPACSNGLRRACSRANSTNFHGAFSHAVQLVKQQCRQSVIASLPANISLTSCFLDDGSDLHTPGLAERLMSYICVLSLIGTRFFITDALVAALAKDLGMLVSE